MCREEARERFDRNIAAPAERCEHLRQGGRTALMVVPERFAVRGDRDHLGARCREPLGPRRSVA